MANTIAPRVERTERVWTPDAKLYVPHEQGEIAFAYPSFGSNTYKGVGQEILSHNLKVPTGDYSASLLHTAYCNKPEKDEVGFIDNIKNLMRSNWLWVFNQNLWTPKGVYVVQDLEAKGRSESLDINQLEKMLKGSKEINGVRFSKNGRVRFAPKETYKLGEQTPNSLSKDGFVVANYNVDGAKKLAEVSSKFKNNPIIYGVEVSEGNNPELRVSALGEFDCWLLVYGISWIDCGRGHAFGVL